VEKRLAGLLDHLGVGACLALVRALVDSG